MSHSTRTDRASLSWPESEKAMAPSARHVKHWADMLRLRPELVSNRGQVTGLQMSLYDAVYRTADVPYQEADYYSDITEPTPSLVRFLGTVGARLGSKRDIHALYHLDQGMGGGKSHALVGAYHLAKHGDVFFRTELGKKARTEAEQIAGRPVKVDGTRVVVLSADNMSPGKTNPVFGPATTLHERFLWALFEGDKKRYHDFRERGPDKAALRAALESAESPVLILLDELMDYAMQLSDAAHVNRMPGEQAFLNALMDIVDDVPQVAFVTVMMRSDLDERGYTEPAQDFRAYIAARLERNGTTVAVSEAQDFAAIIQRRIFERSNARVPTQELVAAYRKGATQPWREQVFEKFGSNRRLDGFTDRVARTYPFHPDLMTLVQEEWSHHAGFQRVRSTVAIFAATAHHWVQEHAAGRWAPTLIGAGDLPVTVVIEDVLSSGLLHGNDKAIQGFRQVAATDISSKDGARGRAVEIDRAQEPTGVTLGYPGAAVRMATALFHYSLVARKQAKRGATRAEILAAAFEPASECEFGNAETLFNLLTSEEEGLGALDTQTGTGSAPTRYLLSTQQTVRMFYRSARLQVQPADRDQYIWKRTQQLATRGLFDEVIPVTRPDNEDTALDKIFEAVDQNGKNRLVVLDPRRWTLLNGRDTQTRADIESLLGLGDKPLSVDNAASCVVACVNTQLREPVRKRAVEVLSWGAVVGVLDREDDQRQEAEAETKRAEVELDREIRRAYQHFAYVVRSSTGVHVEWGRFEDGSKTALKGEHIWDALQQKGRAAKPRGLSGVYLAALLSQVPRTLSLRELSQQFTKNPAFPLVASDHDVRDAIFHMLSDRNQYEIVSSDAQPLTITSADDLALGSPDQLLRHVTGEPADRMGGASQRGRSASMPPSSGSTGVRPMAASAVGSSGAPSDAHTQVRYKQHVIRVRNRSLVDETKREVIWALLGALSDAADPTSGVDLQLIDFELTITAAEGALESVRFKAAAADAKWEERDEDLFM